MAGDGTEGARNGMAASSYLRGLVYRTGMHRALRVLGWNPDAGAAHRTAEYWDGQLAGEKRFYLGGTITIDARNAVVRELMRHHVPRAEALLDVGCAAGALGRVVRGAGIRRYVGVDISQVALDAADRTFGEYHRADLQSFDPAPRGPFDVVVFNEVLYYASVDRAVEEAARYARALREGGAVFFSMKDDPKSRAILAAMRQRFAWVGGMLFQEQHLDGQFALRADRQRPPYLVGIVRPRAAPG